MSSVVANSSGAAPPPSGDEKLRAGTLHYTKAGLLWMFVWLLWGDLVFQLMEVVAPDVLPLRFKELGISDFWLPGIMSVLPLILNTGINPFISTASDRHRGRLGRRIPFLLYSAPFISGALVLIAFSPEIGEQFFRWLGPLTGWTAAGFAIGTLAAFWIMFTLLNMFATTTFYYLFNDVVPSAYMARFFGLFRTISGVAGLVWAKLIFPHSLSHMRIIFVAAAAIYLFGFVLMCLRIKEGQYPPPKPAEGFWTKFASYFKECLSHRLFIYMFVHEMFWMASGACTVYVVFLQRDSLGLNLQAIGDVRFYVGLVALALSFPAGMLGDRIHPMRIMVWIKICMVLVVPLEFVWVFWDPSPDMAFYVLIGLQMLSMPLGLLYETARQPMQMRVWPKTHYGQFCSFNAIARTAAGAVAGTLAGFFMILMRNWFPDAEYGKDYCYRLIPIWKLPFLCGGLIMLLLMYREWNKLGGIHDYKVPKFEAEEGVLQGNSGPAASQADEGEGGKKA